MLPVHLCSLYWVSDFEIRQKEFVDKSFLNEKEIKFVLVSPLSCTNCTMAECLTDTAEIYLFILCTSLIKGVFTTKILFQMADIKARDGIILM